MAEVASRELRNRTRELLQRVAAGEDVTITVGGRPVALLRSLEPGSRWVSRRDFARRLLGHQADPGLARELADLVPDSTDDVPLP